MAIAEMAEKKQLKKFGKINQWGGHGCPSHYGSDIFDVSFTNLEKGI